MINNPNPDGFYSEKEMAEREMYIPKIKKNILNKLAELTHLIKNEVSFPEKILDIDSLFTIDDSLEEILNNWHY